MTDPTEVFQPPDHELVIIAERYDGQVIEPGRTWPCRNRCGYEVVMTQRVLATVVAGGAAMCQPCATELAGRFPGAFRPMSSDN